LGTLIGLALSLPVCARAAGEQVRVGFERTIGAALALGVGGAPERLYSRCPDEGWRPAPPEQSRAYRAAYPFRLRTEPRICPDYSVDPNLRYR
jgi:hypothetical protein